MIRWMLCALLLIAAPDMARASCSGSDIDFEQRRLLGQPEQLCETYGGKVLLVVNVASHCGFTPQYEGLEALYRDYESQGLVVLGFPSPDFGGQEYEDEAEIQKFCKLNFGVSFPIFGLGHVKGPEANPLFKRLAERTGKAPGWNFNKYLVGRDGKVIAHYGSGVKPRSPELIEQIKLALKSSPTTR